jgi:cytochrome c-type biogenesis protein CcmE
MGRKLLVGTLLLGAALLGAVLGLKDDSPSWSRSVTDFWARPIFDRTVRVGGYLVQGTLCRMPDSCEHRFRMSDLRPENPSMLPVHYKGCFVPEAFGDMPGFDVSITVEGTLQSR